MEKIPAGFLIILFLFACTGENEFIESEVDQYIKAQTQFSLLDTFTVNLETILIDSIETDFPEQLLVGKYADPELGEVSAVSYFEIETPGSALSDDKETYDSLTIILSFADLAYGDTLRAQTIFVHRLLEQIGEDDELVYNTTNYHYEDAPLGEITFVPQSVNSDNIEFRLSDSLGIELFARMLAEDDDVSSSSEFRDYFKGLVLVPGDQNSAVLSFQPDSASRLCLYTHLSGLTRTENEYYFRLNTTQTWFNHIESNRSDTPLSLLTSQREAIPSLQTENKAFIQAGAGIVTRLNFPSIGRLLEFEKGHFLYKAELILRPFPQSDKSVELPRELVVYYTDKHNNLISEIVDSDSETLVSTLYFDEFYNENNYYAIDLTEFLIAELSDGFVDPELGIIVTLPEDEFKGSLNRMVIDGRSGSDYRPALNLYYAFFE